MPRPDSERTCIVTREAGSPEGLMRFVVAPDGAVVPDLRGRLPGRGAWVTARAPVVAAAVKRKAFARSFKREVTVAPDLVGQIDALLLADLRQALALANKAGAVVTGFTKVEARIAQGGVAALLHAAEASEDGRRKLAQALRKRSGDTTSGVPVIEDLSEDELSLALGRSHVIHAALVAGAGSDGFLTRWRRLRIYRGSAADEAGFPSGDPGASHDIETAGPEAE